MASARIRSLPVPSRRRFDTAGAAVHSIVSWYFRTVYGRHEGPGILPFYCDPRRIGHFAVTPDELRAGDESALFRLFVALSMYQARRDVVIMKHQLAMSRRAAAALISTSTVARRVRTNPCSTLLSAAAFDRGCSVAKAAGEVDCAERPGAACHVKDAASRFNRMGDLGKLPTSAWLHIWRDGRLPDLLQDVIRNEPNPRIRAEILVTRFSRVRRVGRKLATMFVSALSVPALAPGLTPWFPEIDGNDLVVLDTNVMRAVETLGRIRAAKTYDARVRWVREVARGIDLELLSHQLPPYSPRLVQQALYAFCSRSNRLARKDDCLRSESPCATCVGTLCPRFDAHGPSKYAPAIPSNFVSQDKR